VSTLAQTREQFAQLRHRLVELVTLRADLAELRADLARGDPSPFGGLAELKGMEARFFAELERITETGAQVKGWAPLLLDFPGELDGEPVLWCWLEGDADIAWYHRLDCGFAGRRPAPPPT
jgi:hypothetical protein